MGKISTLTFALLLILITLASADQNLCKLAFEKKDYELASRECQQISQSDPYAQYVLAEIKFESSGELSPAAIKLFMRAANLGVVDAQRRLGELSANGSFGRKNYKQARHWYQAAAEQHDPVSQANLGSLIRSGRGGKKDENLGLMWLQLSAGQGHQDAIKMLNEARKNASGEDLRKVQVLVDDWLSSHPKTNNANSNHRGAL